ncbi:MAG: hypothetical protein U5R31_08345 [Acidimicrobiia bacterium]|nr:hypothetical protein [Acidimicrobiia bacterium]
MASSTAPGLTCSVDWWVGADDRWHLPPREAAVRQRLVDHAPVVETAMRVPGGDVAHRAYGARDRGGTPVVAIEIENAFPGSGWRWRSRCVPDGVTGPGRIAEIDVVGPDVLVDAPPVSPATRTPAASRAGRQCCRPRRRARGSPRRLQGPRVVTDRSASLWRRVGGCRRRSSAAPCATTLYAVVPLSGDDPSAASVPPAGRSRRAGGPTSRARRASSSRQASSATPSRRRGHRCCSRPAGAPGCARPPGDRRPPPPRAGAAPAPVPPPTRPGAGGARRDASAATRPFSQVDPRHDAAGAWSHAVAETVRVGGDTASLERGASSDRGARGRLCVAGFVAGCVGGRPRSGTGARPVHRVGAEAATHRDDLYGLAGLVAAADLLARCRGESRRWRPPRCATRAEARRAVALARLAAEPVPASAGPHLPADTRVAGNLVACRAAPARPAPSARGRGVGPRCVDQTAVVPLGRADGAGTRSRS